MSTAVRDLRNSPSADPWRQRVDAGDWDAVTAEIDEYGGALCVCFGKVVGVAVPGDPALHGDLGGVSAGLPCGLRYFLQRLLEFRPGSHHRKPAVAEATGAPACAW